MSLSRIKDTKSYLFPEERYGDSKADPYKKGLNSVGTPRVINNAKSMIKTFPCTYCYVVARLPAMLNLIYFQAKGNKA